MVEIYIKHANGEVMEVQNWDTLTDYGAMITRQLSVVERDRYFSLKQTLNMRDSEIWRLLHPPMSQMQPPTASSQSSSKSSPPSFSRNHRKTQPLFHSASGSIPPSPPPSKGAGGISDSDPEIKIGSCELSKRALLHIIRRACGRDIEPLQKLALDDLQALAANVVLPKEGVPVRVMPRSA